MSPFVDPKQVFVARLSGTERKYIYYRDYTLVFINCVTLWPHKSLTRVCCSSGYLLN